MHVIETPEAVSFESLGQECQYYWSKLPGRSIFIGLAVAWCLLFYFFGWTSMVVGRTDSLYAWMWDKWCDPANDAEHCKLIPWVVMGLLWLRRQQLIKSVQGMWWPGLFGLGAAALLHVVGYVVQQPRFSMVALFFGGWTLVGLVWGKETLKVAFFPFFIFAFCLPMGGTFAQGLTLPLREFAARGAYFITHDLLEVRVAIVGTKLYDPAHIYGNFEVAAECSGIRSFVALLAITTIFSVLTMRTPWKRAVMLAATIPLALFCNIVRVTTIVLAAYTCKSQAAGQTVDHYFGYVTYAMAIAGMLLLARILREKPVAAAP